MAYECCSSKGFGFKFIQFKKVQQTNKATHSGFYNKSECVSCLVLREASLSIFRTRFEHGS